MNLIKEEKETIKMKKVIIDNTKDYVLWENKKYDKIYIAKSKGSIGFLCSKYYFYSKLKENWIGLSNCNSYNDKKYIFNDNYDIYEFDTLNDFVRWYAKQENIVL